MTDDAYMENNVLYWGTTADKELRHTDMDDAIADILENHAGLLPQTINIYGFMQAATSVDDKEGVT